MYHSSAALPNLQFSVLLSALYLSRQFAKNHNCADVYVISTTIKNTHIKNKWLVIRLNDEIDGDAE